MKVLILCNTAATFNPVANWLLDHGHEVRMIMNSVWDLGRCTQDHPAGIVTDSARSFYKVSIQQIKQFKPDVIHVSSSIKMLVLARLYAPRTPIVFSYHGSEVRGRKKRHYEAKLADVVTVSTPDLQQYGVWYDRPVEACFYYRGSREPNTAFMLYNDNFILDQREFARQWCKERCIKLTILDRSEPGHVTVPYYQMPFLYSKYEYYLDFKGHIGRQYALSKAAMEAFACGCKVIHEEGQVENIKFPDPDEYYRLYDSLKRSSVWGTLKRIPVLVYGLTRTLLGLKQ